eukprot:9663704-Alexandrium_andersonii.AAC.1
MSCNQHARVKSASMEQPDMLTSGECCGAPHPHDYFSCLYCPAVLRVCVPAGHVPLRTKCTALCCIV